MSRFQEYMAARAPSNPLAEAAAALGVPVFPCNAQKRPLTEHGFKDASANPSAIKAMFDNPVAVMIGMPTGEITGVVVVDVDVKAHRQGMDWLNANSHRMPQTRTIRTGSGGLHIYMAWPGQKVKNSNDKIAPGIDVRGDGGYVVLPPSPGYAVADNAPVADVPEWFLPVLCPPEPVAPSIPPQPRVASQHAGNTPYGQAALVGECDAIRNAPFGSQESTINAACLKIGALVAGGELVKSHALAEMLAAARSIPSQPGKPAWRASELEHKVRRAMDDGVRQPRTAPEPDPEPIHPAAILLAKLHAKATKQAHKPLEVTPGLMDVGGAVGMFVDYCEATAISPQPFLSLAAGICAVGVLAGRRYRTRTNLRTNIYAVSVADSGAGKDHARKRLKAIMAAANLTHYMGGEDIASGAAMLTALHRHPCVLFQIDEFGDWLSGVLGRNAPPHKRQVAERLKTLYSSADSYIAGTEYADQSKIGRPREDIHQPHACMYGTTTPAQFWAAIAGTSMQDGLLARVLMFVSPESYPDEHNPEQSDPPPELVQAFQAIATGPDAAPEGNLAGLMSSAIVPEPYTAQETPQAAEAILALRREQIALQRKAAGTYVTAIAARWAENAVKLALVRAVSRDPAQPVLQVSDVAWGKALARHCIETLLQDAERHIAESEYERRINKAMDIIRRHGPITGRDIFRRGLKLPERDRAEILKTLTDSGMVLAVPDDPGPQGGRPTVRYQAIHTPATGEDSDDTPSGTS